jgi:acyl-CoA thioester hydrolase
MLELPMAGLRHRVLIGRERVKFADADPYAHLASGAFVDMIMSHRVEVLQDLLGFSIMQFARTGIAFPARSVTVSYVRPAFVGDVLEIASWVEQLGTSSFEVRAVVAGADDRTVRATASVQFVTVDTRTGKSLPIPETLPSSAETDPIPGLSTWGEYRGTLVGLPDRWTETLDPGS